MLGFRRSLDFQGTEKALTENSHFQRIKYGRTWNNHVLTSSNPNLVAEMSDVLALTKMEGHLKTHHWLRTRETDACGPSAGCHDLPIL